MYDLIIIYYNYYYLFTGNGFKPAYDETNIMLPLDCFRRNGATSLANKYDDFRLTSKILSHASSGQSKTEPTVGLTAAFETRISIFPKLLIAASNRFFRSSAIETWHLTPITSENPSLFNWPTAFFTFSSFRLLIMIFAPSAANRLAIANPILNMNLLNVC